MNIKRYSPSLCHKGKNANGGFQALPAFSFRQPVPFAPQRRDWGASPSGARPGGTPYGGGKARQAAFCAPGQHMEGEKHEPACFHKIRIILSKSVYKYFSIYQ